MVYVASIEENILGYGKNLIR